MADLTDTVQLDVPDVFAPLPLVADDGLRSKLEVLADERVPNATSTARRGWIDYCAGAVRLAGSAETRYVGACLLGDEGTATSTAVLLVATSPLDFTDTRVAAAGITQTLHGSRAREARLLELPCGPAAAVAGQDRLDVADGSPIPPTAVNSVQFYIPWSGRKRMLVVSLSSPSPADWDQYARLGVRIARSIRFPAAVRS